jgi:transposase
MREIINGIFDTMRAGWPWRLLPTDVPPWGTIYRWFARSRDTGRFEAINHLLVMEGRERHIHRCRDRPPHRTANMSFETDSKVPGSRGTTWTRLRPTPVPETQSLKPGP